MAVDVVTLALAKKFTKKSLEGLGALKGSPCILTDVEDIISDGKLIGCKMTFSWTTETGDTETSSFNIPYFGIANMEYKDATRSAATFEVTYLDGRVDDFIVPLPQQGDHYSLDGIEMVLSANDWDENNQNTLHITGVFPDSQIIVGPASKEDSNAWLDAELWCLDPEETNKLVFEATNVPTQDITVRVVFGG